MNLNKYLQNKTSTPAAPAPVAQNTTVAAQQSPQQTKDFSEVDFNQIKRIDGKGCFVEVLKDGFELKSKTSEGKVHMNFVSYDQTSHKQKAWGSFWLSMSEWLILNDYFHSPDFAEDYVSSVQAAQANGESYAKPIKEFMKGSMIKNQLVSRTFRICPGQKSDMIVLQYMSGPGKREDSGIVRPAGKADTFITVPMTIDAWLGTLALVNQEMIAYKVTENLKNHFENIIDMLNMSVPTSGSSNADVSTLTRLEEKLDTILREMD